MVNIIYPINLNHLYSIMFLFLTLFVSMILQLATISYVSQCCAQIIKSFFLFNHEGIHYLYHSLVHTARYT